MQRFIYGTGNAAKLEYMRDTLAALDFEILGLDELGITLPPVDESGDTPSENARIKALAYYAAVKEQTGKAYPVFSCDSGLYFDNVPDALQPGVHIRNVGGRYLDDAGMTAYYAALAGKFGGRITARYRNAICLVLGEDDIREHMGDDIASRPFMIASKPHPDPHRRVAGFPLDCLSVHIESGKYYYDLEDTASDDVYAKSGFREFFGRVLNDKETVLPVE